MSKIYVCDVNITRGCPFGSNTNIICYEPPSILRF